MPLPTSGNLSLSQVQTEFGAPAGTGLSAFLRGGAWVPNTGVNSGVPTALPIALRDLLGASNTVDHSVSANDILANRPVGVTAQGDSTATVTDGIGPFTFSWAFIAGGAGISLSNTTSQTVTAIKSSTSFGQATGTLRVSVTDTGNGNLVKTADVSVELTNENF